MEKSKSQKITVTAVLTAVIIVLQLIGGSIRIGAVSVSFVLLPIVIGSMISGKLSGAILGLVFGLITFFMGLFGIDGFTFVLISNYPFLTFLTCVVKATTAGFVSGLVFEIFSKKNELTATFLASAVAPVVNTSIFILGALLMKNALTGFLEEGQTVIYFLVIVCAGVNFLIELAVNVIFAPTLYRIYKILRRNK